MHRETYPPFKDEPKADQKSEEKQEKREEKKQEEKKEEKKKFSWGKLAIGVLAGLAVVVVVTVASAVFGPFGEGKNYVERWCLAQ